VTNANAPGTEDAKAKKAKDTVDAYLAQLKDLQAANAMRIPDGRRAIDILAEEEAALADATTTTERYAQALERINKLRELGFMTSRDKPGLMPIDRELPDLNKDYEVGDVRRKLTPFDAKDFAPSPIVDPETFTAWDLWTAGQTEAFNDAMESFKENVIRGFADTLSSAIRDGLTEGFSERRTGASGMRLFFNRMRNMLGEQLSQLGGTVIELGSRYVLKGLGKLFQKVGFSMGVFGRLMMRFQSALASHPLTMGAVAIAVGIGLSALAGRISTAAREGGGGDIGGTLGGLSIGNGGVAPQTYIFPRDRAKTQPTGMTLGGGDKVIVNFNGPIIGPNDPSAQRQIMTLIDNAQRRGLGSGSSGRSV
jgi:hypothetical protein